MIQGQNAGIVAALAAAALFGAGTPLAKLLLAHTSPWLLAGLLYLGSGLGLTLYRLDSIMAGDMGEIADALRAHYQMEALKAQSEGN